MSADLQRERDYYRLRCQELEARLERLEAQSRAVEVQGPRADPLYPDLCRALEGEQFELYFHPQVDLKNGRVTGLEALIRWHHPDQGMVSPDRFIPLAEATGLIEPIGQWVLRTACRQAQYWRARGLSLTMGVNLSARQFRAGLDRLVESLLKETGLPPGLLELEITEGVLMEDVTGAVALLDRLKAMGVKIAIDDFGTGYSSLSYLKRLPLDRLKIDRSFVRDITRDADDAAIVQAVIAMARSMKLEVVAEGVETREQLAFLRGRHCDVIQGYYFSKPLPEAAMTELLARKDRLPLEDTEGGGRRAVLVVDDERFVLKLLKQMLEREGYRVLTAQDAQEGFDRLALNRVGVVVSDQWMPAMKGTEFLARVRDLYPDTVRIVLSGESEMADLVEAINEGAIYKFLAKPVVRDSFIRTLREAFLLHEARESVAVTAAAL